MLYLLLRRAVFYGTTPILWHNPGLTRRAKPYRKLAERGGFEPPIGY